MLSHRSLMGASLVLLTFVVCGRIVRTKWNSLSCPLGIGTSARGEETTITKRGHTNNCTPQLLTNYGNRNDKNKDNEVESGWWRHSETTDSYYWQVSSRVQEACRLPTNRICPLQSTAEDIQQMLDGKWILMVGDSSVRMLHDYFIGRWLGNYKHWPTNMSIHGPESHSVSCQQNATCQYEVHFRGVRVSFLWMSYETTPALQAILQSTVGLPDLVIAQHSYWESYYSHSIAQAKQHTDSIVRNLTEILQWQEMKSEYPFVYANATARPKKVWFSTFNRNFFRRYYGAAANESLYTYDGTELAHQLGWDILDRSYFGVDPRTNESARAHPMGEILELELEFLLLIIRSLPKV